MARAYGGALLFALPLFMTMEMWWLGFYMSRLRLLILLLLSLPLLVGLSFHSGFRDTFDLREDVVDALVAYAVGTSATLIVLFATHVIGPEASLREIAGKSILQAVPASMGALLAQSQLGAREGEEKRRRRDPTYRGELFIMGVGSLFMAFNIAPTAEIVVIAERVDALHSLSLAALSIGIMHGFVYGMRFKGHAHATPGTPAWQLFLRFTVPGYGLVLVLSVFMLWLFGRLDGLSIFAAGTTAIVLGVPGAIGAAAARLIL